MPISYQLDQLTNIVVMDARGDLDLKQDIVCLQRIMADPDFHPGMSLLVDCRKESPMADADYIWQVADAFTQSGMSSAFSKVAIVVSQIVSVGMSNMFITLTAHSSPPVQVFQNVLDAEHWLSRSNGNEPSDPH